MAAALTGGAAQRRRDATHLRLVAPTRAADGRNGSLAEACHHSSGSFPPTLKERRTAGQGVAYDTRLRGQKTARTAGLQLVRQRQVSVGDLQSAVLRVGGLLKALSQDRVPPLVVDMILLSLLGGVALRMRLVACTFGMCTRARRDGHLQCRGEEEESRDEEDDADEERRTKTWTRSTPSLVFPLGSYPCGCAGGSPPGSSSRRVCSLTR